MNDSLIRESEIRFLLWDWLNTGELFAQPRYQALDRETVDAVMGLSGKIAETSFLPHYKMSDSKEPWMDEAGEVHVLPEIGAALKEYAEAGLFAAGFDERFGGLNLPMVTQTASMAQFMAANTATAAYAMLTVANARVIVNFGTETQIAAFAEPQIAGSSFGTMALSEPQAGSGLGDIRTRATPDGEDEYGKRFRLVGNKMWITGGDQDISDNIVHLVLAKIPDQDGALPGGTKGISLFIVPKRLPDRNERNDVAVAGLNHKMGYRGTSNCLLNLGEGRFEPQGQPGAIGYLLGNPGQGLAIMFQMMNEARISVGLGAAALGYRGYRLALRYASERTQGSSLFDGTQDRAVPIIEHPDVQHMLLAQKCYAEGGLAIVLYCASLIDRQETDPEAAELLALLTPVAKAWPSEWCLIANQLAIQVHGGYGYTRDFDVEQLYRDNRLNAIHEGTTGIQALDLLGRKILRAKTDALDVLGRKIEATVQRAAEAPELTAHGAALSKAWHRILEVAEGLRNAEHARALSNATSFLLAFGHVVLAWVWLDKAILCAHGVEGQDSAFLAGKMRTCRFFYEAELPKTGPWLEVAQSVTDVAVNVPADQF